MKDKVNEQNVKADTITYGTWSKRGDQFADEEPLKMLYEMFRDVQPELPHNLKIIELGSADGVVGEYFKKKLKKDGYIPQLTILDAVAEHLKANTNPETIKIHKNLLDIDIQDEYDLGIMRSVLHYFSEEAQKEVATNIYTALKLGGYFLSQNFIQMEESLGLYVELSYVIGKQLRPALGDDVLEMFKEVGFEEVRELGDFTWHYEANMLSKEI